MAKAAHWHATDPQGRKRGEQTGLDTLVVHALNDGCSVSVPLSICTQVLSGIGA